MEKTKLKIEEEASQVFSECFEKTCAEYLIPIGIAREIKAAWKMKYVPAHTLLFERGQYFTEIWFVAYGAIRSSRIVDDKEWIYSLSVQKQYIGDYKSYLTGKPSILSFETMADSVIYVIEKNDLEKIYDQYPEANEFGRFLAEYATSFINQRILGMQTMSLKERYKRLLETFPEVAQKMHQQDIAAYLGAKPQSLSRMKSQLLKGDSPDLQ
ncbi:MAG: hypothetical protein DI598_04720 [Pseudopedobacter saltans]|uniref:Cyclic nucleotide-binding domain-containing protein n=1 Tax=Pseudopedobacter saltans TaxID=151895 RepID=A0A2W5F9E6_9SPHI|nr:MAG: hypothetical protein DI598_04720 [Pseudopedobacter saltans]